jgi:hypothetical protein
VLWKAVDWTRITRPGPGTGRRHGPGRLWVVQRADGLHPAPLGRPRDDSDSDFTVDRIGLASIDIRVNRNRRGCRTLCLRGAGEEGTSRTTSSTPVLIVVSSRLLTSPNSVRNRVISGVPSGGPVTAPWSRPRKRAGAGGGGGGGGRRLSCTRSRSSRRGPRSCRSRR